MTAQAAASAAASAAGEAAAAAGPAASADPLLIGAFFAALGAASYQEVRWRSALNALTLAMAAIAAAHLAAAYGGQAAPPAMLAAVAAAMLGLLRLAGLYGTADWAALSSLFAVLLPAGLHLAVLSVLAAVSLPCLHVVAVCAASNARGRLGGRGRGGGEDGGEDGGEEDGGENGRGRGRGGWLGAAASFVSSKRRSASDRWAYAAAAPAPEGSAPDGARRPLRGPSWRGPRAGALLGPGSRYAGRVSPSVPVLAHSCAASAALLAVVGPRCPGFRCGRRRRSGTGTGPLRPPSRRPCRGSG